MKKPRVVVLALFIALFVAAGCGPGTQQNPNGENAFSYRLPDKFVAWLNDLKWFPVLEEQTGVDVTLVDGGPQSEYYQQLDLSLASGQIEDAVLASSSQTDVYGPQGAFLDLAPLIAEHAPNIAAYIEANPDFKKLITSPDGKIWAIPAEYPRIANVTMYRSDMFADAGISKPPTDLAQLAEALRRLKAHYRDVKDYYPLTGREDFVKWTWVVGASFGADGGTIKGVDAGSQLSVDLDAPGYRELIAWYHDLYVEGLIDPEWVRGAGTEENWQTKMLTGKGTVSHDFFTRPSWFMNNGGPENDPDYNIEVLPAFNGADGQPAKVPANARWNLERMLAISAKSEKAEQVLKFLDHLYTPEGQTTMHFGVEGTSYKQVDGKPSYTVDFEKEGNQPVGTPVWNFLQDRMTFPAPVDNEAFYSWMDEKTKSFAGDYFSTSLVETPVIKYTPEQQKRRSDLLAAVEPYFVAELTKFVTGERDLSEWDGFVAECKTRGYAELHDIDQAAWTAMGN